MTSDETLLFSLVFGSMFPWGLIILLILIAAASGGKK